VTYRVDWLQSALDELAAVWLRADVAERKAITAASHQIDQQLQTDPDDQSESRSGGRRLLIVAPLGVTFRVEPATSTVAVLHVWRFRQRKS
jgi:hypothetical protein